MNAARSTLPFDPPRTGSRLPASRRVAVTGTLLVCLLATDAGMAPVALKAAEDKAPVHAPDDGFTRESMAALGQPEPTPAPAGPIVSPQVMRPAVDSKDFTPPRHRHQVTHARHTRHQTRVASARQRTPRRNPVVSFVYWWNGFVIRKFHTKFGTVMLHTIGAKT